MLKALPFVEWDRYTETEPGREYAIYGWIPREKDGYKDFVVLTYYGPDHFAYQEGFAFITSSAKHTHAIADMVRTASEAEDPHNDCIRVESTFPDVQNVIHLK